MNTIYGLFENGLLDAGFEYVEGNLNTAVDRVLYKKGDKYLSLQRRVGFQFKEIKMEAAIAVCIDGKFYHLENTEDFYSRILSGSVKSISQQLKEQAQQ